MLGQLLDGIDCFLTVWCGEPVGWRVSWPLGRSVDNHCLGGLREAVGSASHRLHGLEQLLLQRVVCQGKAQVRSGICAAQKADWRLSVARAAAGACLDMVFLPSRWDDALDVWGVHGVGGLIGMISVGVCELRSLPLSSAVAFSRT